MADGTDMSPEQMLALNARSRAMCVQQGVLMRQPIFSQTFDPTSNAILNVAPRYAGLILGFVVQVSGTITNNAGGVATRTELGAYNLLQQCVLTDLNNQQRINTTGWHLGLINSARQGYVFGGAYSPNVPENYGNNWSVQTMPSTIAASTDAAVSQFFYVPCSYSLQDLRGAIYAAVNNATMNLQLTINTTNLFKAAGDATLSAYSTAAASGNWKTGANCTVQVWQVYLDQLPRYQQTGQPILPVIDLNNIYELKNTFFTGFAVNQDFPMAYPNYRQFLSTIAIYDNGGTLGIGADINYWALQSANFTNVFKLTPQLAALQQRQAFMADPPKGVYFFDTRNSPISTANFGNMELVLNPITVNSNAQILMGYEDFAQINQLVGATSLPGGGG